MSADVFPQHDHNRHTKLELQRNLELWCVHVGECAHKPSRRRVHGLRAATLRLQAELDEISQHCALTPAAVRAAERWSRKARRVRKLLAPVRDADVSLQLLATFNAPSTTTDRALSPQSRDSLRAMKRLARALRSERDAARKRMVLVLEAQLARIKASVRELEQSLSGSEPTRINLGEALAAITTQLTAAARRLTPDALHSFRKLAKTGRYLAEHMPQQETQVLEVAAQCRAIQAAVGKWRDWTLLAERAKQLVSHQEGRALAQELEATSERLLNEAVKQCLRSVAVISDQAQYQLVRRPVRSVPRSPNRRLA